MFICFQDLVYFSIVRITYVRFSRVFPSLSHIVFAGSDERKDKVKSLSFLGVSSGLTHLFPCLTFEYICFGPFPSVYVRLVRKSEVSGV